MADGQLQIIYTPATQPGTVTIVSTEDRVAAEAARDASEQARDAAIAAQQGAEAAEGTFTAPANDVVATMVTNDGATKTAVGAAVDAQVKPVAIRASHVDSSGMVTSMLGTVRPRPNPDAPVLTVSGPGGANPIGTGVDYPFNMTSGVTAIGCYPVTYNALSTDYTQNQMTGETGAGARPWAIEFITDSQNAVMTFRSATSGGPIFDVWVDGAPIARRPRTFTTNISPNSKSYLKLAFTTAKSRRVRIYMNGADYGGLRVDTGKTATAATIAEPFSFAAYGDSWMAGTTLAGWPDLPGTVLGRILGWQVFECGIGGTGYAASSQPYTIASRTTPLYAVAPNYVLAFGSINDNSQTPSAIQSAATAFYNGIATNLPNTKIIVVGPQPVPSNYATSTALLANRDAVKAAATAAPNVLGFIDPIEQGWLNGTGNIAAPAGDGNRDAFIQGDSLHPTKQGAWYYATRMAEEIIRLLDKNGLTW